MGDKEKSGYRTTLGFLPPDIFLAAWFLRCQVGFKRLPLLPLLRAGFCVVLPKAVCMKERLVPARRPGAGGGVKWEGAVSWFRLDWGGWCLPSPAVLESGLHGVAALTLFHAKSGICKQMAAAGAQPRKGLGLNVTPGNSDLASSQESSWPCS